MAAAGRPTAGMPPSEPEFASACCLSWSFAPGLPEPSHGRTCHRYLVPFADSAPLCYNTSIPLHRK